MTALEEGLPAGWRRARLGDLGEWHGGGTPSKSETAFWQGGNIPWVSPKDMKSDRILDSEDHITAAALRASAASLLPAGTVLVVTRSGILERTLPVAVATVPVTVNQDLKGLIPREDVEPSYLAYALRAFEREILQTCAKSGTTVASIEFPRLKDFTIPLAPVAMQRRLVAEIEKQLTRVDAGVEALKRLQSHLRRYRVALLKAACEGRLVPYGNVGLAEESGPDLVARLVARRGAKKPVLVDPLLRLEDLPAHWGRAALGALADTSSGGTPSRSRPDLYGGGIPWVKSGELRDGLVREVEEHITQEALNSSSAKLFPSGTVCVALYGATVGKVGILGMQAATNQAVCGVIMPPELDRQFLFRFLQGSRPRLIARGKGGAQPNISQEIVRRLEVPVPPHSEQVRIVAELEARISGIDAMEASASVGLKKASSLRLSVLRAAFNGTLDTHQGSPLV